MSNNEYVMVLRELLERLANKCAFLSDTRKAQDELRALLAQPEQSGEEVVVVAIVTLGGIFHGGSGPELGDIDIEPNMPALERIQCELVDSSDDETVDLMTVSQHQRIDAARIAEIERLRTELGGLRRFAAEIYQVLGTLDAPANVLDNASDAASGVPLRHESLLVRASRDGWRATMRPCTDHFWLLIAWNRAKCARCGIVAKHE